MRRHRRWYRHWLDGNASSGSQRYGSARSSRFWGSGRELGYNEGPTTGTNLGAKVYITGRRMEVLENAAKTHSPEDEGEIIP